MSTERKLKNRRRRRASKGQLVRVSDTVHAELTRMRRGHRSRIGRLESWDCMFRRMLGLPDRTGRPQTLVEGMLEVHSGTFVMRLQDSHWKDVEEVACRIADRESKRRKVTLVLPVRMREMR